MICIMDCPTLSFLIVHTRSGTIGLAAYVGCLHFKASTSSTRAREALSVGHICVASHLFECVCRTVLLAKWKGICYDNSSRAQVTKQTKSKEAAQHPNTIWKSFKCIEDHG